MKRVLTFNFFYLVRRGWHFNQIGNYGNSVSWQNEILFLSGINRKGHSITRMGNNWHCGCCSEGGRYFLHCYHFTISTSSLFRKCPYFPCLFRQIKWSSWSGQSDVEFKNYPSEVFLFSFPPFRLLKDRKLIINRFNWESFTGSILFTLGIWK